METEGLYHDLQPLLLSVAYHTLGSMVEAEDTVQDVFLKWAESRPLDVRDPKAYLCRMVHNLSVDRIRAASRERAAYVGQWLPEPVPTGDEPGVDPLERVLHGETLSTAGLLLMQKLNPTERVVFVLRELFHYRFDEIAPVVQKSTVACRQLFHRAKRRIGPLPDGDRSAMAEAGLVTERIAQAIVAGDIGMLVDLLSQDAILHTDSGGRVKAALQPLMGADRVLRYFGGIQHLVPPGYRCVTGQINGFPGIRLEAGGITIAVITFRFGRDQVEEIYVVMNPEKLTQFNRT